MYKLMATPAISPEAKLAAVLSPLLDKERQAILDRFAVGTHEVLLAVQEVNQRLGTLEKLVANDKKRVTRDKKPEEETPTDPAAPPPKTLAHNKPAFFKEKYKNDLEFRAKHIVDDNMRKLMSEDSTVKTKTKEDQKLLAEANFAWNYLKKNYPAMITAVEAEYDALKIAQTVAAKPAQQVADTKTPPNEKA